MFKGIETVVYYVDDLKAASQWYKKVLNLEPNHDSEFYVGFTVGGDELGLHPTDGDPRQSGAPGQTAHWSVENIEAAVAHLLAAGAKEHHKVDDVGGGIKIASVIDPFGNVFGLIQNPRSPNR